MFIHIYFLLPQHSNAISQLCYNKLCCSQKPLAEVPAIIWFWLRTSSLKTGNRSRDHSLKFKSLGAYLLISTPKNSKTWKFYFYGLGLFLVLQALHFSNIVILVNQTISGDNCCERANTLVIINQRERATSNCWEVNMFPMIIIIFYLLSNLGYSDTTLVNRYHYICLY